MIYLSVPIISHINLLQIFGVFWILPVKQITEIVDESLILEVPTLSED